jgi:DNA-binding NtrC family response regulator
MPTAQPDELRLFEDGHLRALHAIEADIICIAIAHYNGSLSEVARRLGIGRSTLYRKIEEFGINSAAGNPREEPNRG